MFRTWGRMTAIMGAILMVAALSSTVPATAASGGGNVQCRDGFTTLKYDGMPEEGTTFSDGTVTVTVDAVRKKADGSGEVYGVELSQTGAQEEFYVILKAGPIASVFGLGLLTGLNTQLAPSGRHYAISNVVFCYQV